MLITRGGYGLKKSDRELLSRKKETILNGIIESEPELIKPEDDQILFDS